MENYLHKKKSKRCLCRNENLLDRKAYISRDSEFYANRFIEKLIDGVERLSLFPEMGRIVPEAQNIKIRELVYQSYRIIYKVSKKQISIVTVINSRRDLNNPELKRWEIG